MIQFPDELLKLPEPPIKSGSTRMEDPVEARKLVGIATREDQMRSYFRAIVKGCYDGNPPYSEKQRAESGGRWMANLNFMELQGIMDAARIPYYALFSGVKAYCTFETDYDRLNRDWTRWNETVADEWMRMLKKWKQFNWHMRASQFEMLFEGWGPVMWEDETNWRFRAFPARNLLVPQGTESCLDERVPWVIVRCSYRVHELYDKISSPEVATERGWNVEAARYAIKNATRKIGGETWQTAPWERWQQKFKNHDLTSSYTESDIINCAHIFVQEFAAPGEQAKISHFIVTESDLPDAKGEAAGFLYKHANRYESYHEAMVVCFQNTGDGTWHSVRGVGLKAFKHVEVSNRLKCTVINNAMLASCMTIQPQSAQAEDKVQQIRFGHGVVWIPPNTEFIQNRLGGDIQGPMAVDRMLSNNLGQNIGHYNQRSITREDGRGERPTATEVEYASAKETSLSQAQIDSYYDDLDTIAEQMYRRALKQPDKESKEFVRRCLERGVPMEALEKMYCVKWNRLSGYPSPESRKRNLRETAWIMASLPPDGQRAFLNEVIATHLGPDKIDAFNPQLQQPDIDQAFAVLENAAMSAGELPLVVSGMNPVKHLQIHLGDAEEKMDPLREAMEQGGGIDPAELEKAYAYIQILGPHCEEHLAQMKDDQSRSDLYKLFSAQLKNLASFHGKLRGAILDARRQAQQAALEQQAANALGVMDQARLNALVAENQRRDLAFVREQQRKDSKAVSTQNLRTWEAEQANRRKTAETMANIGIKRIEANASNGSDQ